MTTFDFCLATETAIKNIVDGAAQPYAFSVDGTDYEMEYENSAASVFTQIDGQRALYANVARLLVQSIYPDVFLTLDYKQYVKEIITQDVNEFTYVEEDGTEAHYMLYRQNDQWMIEWVEDTYVVDSYSYPTKEHIMGTDGNGMDLLTRLMYGGRVSLYIGFIVVILELFIGVVLGGIAGYFGKWVDNLIMRIVDVFNSIPMLPVIIIIGAIMDQYRIDPQLRMVFLMIMLAVFGWPGIARLTRGQILSLREQEFMLATEATGLSVEKRIFKHLVPNVIPQLIVIATLSLGGVILTESVLSFLGLGVKHPFASWGNIINAVSNVHVMTNYLFVWIPAGFCILITVLGFNFIGDGLRDAFDPKMKR
jgi:peptide/nickel transport system permease protein